MPYPIPGSLGYMMGFSAVTAQSLTINASGSITMGSGAVIKLDASTSTTSCPLQKNGDPNTGLTFPGADQMNAVVGGTARLQLGGATADVLMTGTNQVAYLQFTESGAPSAPPADKVYVYAAVDGGSKTDLLALFQSGAAQTVAQEP